MQCRNGTDDPLGNFDCAFGFPCDTTTRMCDCSSSSMFTHDTTLMKIPNCGLPIVALYIGYILTAVFSFFVCGFSLYEARGRKPATKQFLYVGAVWTFLLPFLQLAHYLEGNTFGVASILAFYFTIQLVNIQVIMFSFQILSLLALLSKPGFVAKLRKFMTRWLAFWSLCKVVPSLILLVSVITCAIDVFNGTTLAFALLLMAEVAVNTTGQWAAMRSLIKELQAISGSSDTSYFKGDKVISVLEFAVRLQKVLPIALIYGIIVWLLGITTLALYGIFHFAIPFMWIMYVGMMVSWPTLALNCILLSRDAILKKIEGMKRSEEEPRTFSLFQDHGRTIRNHERQAVEFSPIASMPIPEEVALRDGKPVNESPSGTSLSRMDTGSQLANGMVFGTPLSETRIAIIDGADVQ